MKDTNAAPDRGPAVTSQVSGPTAIAIVVVVVLVVVALGWWWMNRPSPTPPQGVTPAAQTAAHSRTPRPAAAD